MVTAGAGVSGAGCEWVVVVGVRENLRHKSAHVGVVSEIVKSLRHSLLNTQKLFSLPNFPNYYFALYE